jgi:hypothetical protein
MNIKIKKSVFKALYDIACEGWKSKFDEKFKKFNFSDTIEFEKEFLVEMKKACDKDQIIIFNKIFSKFLKEDDRFKISDYSNICKVLKVKVLTEKDFSFLPKEQRKKAFYFNKIQNLVRYFNGDWIADWNNPNQPKYYPYFDKRSGGWVFVGSLCGCVCSCAVVGFYKDEETSTYVGKTFLDIYKGYLEN